jgi:hypothetical protein
MIVKEQLDEDFLDEVVDECRSFGKVVVNKEECCK